MKAGAGKCVIALPHHFFPAEGFSRQVDDLHARVLLVEDHKRYALLSLELTSLPPEEMEELKTMLRRTTGAGECFVCVTHTFSAPHLMPDHILRDSESKQKKAVLKCAIQQAAENAANNALARLTESILMMGASQCKVNAPRDIQTSMGWWVDTCGEGFVDHKMTVVRINDQAGSAQSLLVHYPVQSSVLDGSQLLEGGKAVSGDLAGMMCTELEQRFPGSIVLFLMGAAGDQAPIDKAVRCFVDETGEISLRDKQDEGLALCHELSRKMADSATEAVSRAQPMLSSSVLLSRADVCVPAKKMERDLKKLRPTHVPPYVPDGETTQDVTVLVLGDLKIVGVKPELCCKTSFEISGDTPHVIIASMFDGGAKYMADADSYDRITYEAMNSPFGKGAAEKLAQAARGLLRQASIRI